MTSNPLFLAGAAGCVAFLLALALTPLAKRLSLYRLRRKIAIAEDSTLGVCWQAEGEPTDPRLPALGHRWIAPVSADDMAVDDAWRAHPLAHGVPRPLCRCSAVLQLYIQPSTVRWSPPLIELASTPARATPTLGWPPLTQVNSA